jgi:hypothetical protein
LDRHPLLAYADGVLLAYAMLGVRRVTKWDGMAEYGAALSSGLDCVLFFNISNYEKGFAMVLTGETS